MVDGGDKVLLLARPGDARERLEAALREAGAGLVAVADPVSADADELVAMAPSAVLVALEPAIEEVLDAFEPLLSNPNIAVIFDEAELAAQRAGWDAARWVRHLAAKLHRHDDVLPPGREQDNDWQPQPGPLPSGYRAISDQDLETIADEAQSRADEVPRDSGLDPAGRPDDAPQASASDEGADAGLVDFDAAALEAALEGFELQSAPPPETDEQDLRLDVAPLQDVSRDASLEGVQLDGVDLDGMAFADIGFEQAGDDTDPGVAPAREPAVPGLDDLLSAPLPLDDGDDAGIVPEPDAETGSDIDLATLEQRISGLSLADVDSYGHGPERGAVLVEGGLGGPDAVRQLLAVVPAGFPRPVLVRLRLDGGRYDRLVRQMERAAQLPVALAEDGTEVQPGHVYFLPPDIGLLRDRAQLRFVHDVGAAGLFPEALPPGDSAVLFLSGSDPGLVQAALEYAAHGALVAGQSPEGCYDAVAAEAVVARGGDAGTPATLAERLVGRWPPPDRPAGEDLEEPEA